MYRSIVSLLLLIPLVLAATPPPTSNTTYLIAPAIVTTSHNTSAIQCWRILSPFSQSSVPGVKGAQSAVVSNNTNLAYTILPPRYDGGIHTAPAPQLVHFLSGVAHVTLPQEEGEGVWIVGGKGGLIFAVDTTGRGHITRYPSDQETVAITAPFTGGVIPKHEVIAEGPCLGSQTFL